MNLSPSPWWYVGQMSLVMWVSSVWLPRDVPYRKSNRIIRYLIILFTQNCNWMCTSIEKAINKISSHLIHYVSWRVLCENVGRFRCTASLKDINISIAITKLPTDHCLYMSLFIHICGRAGGGRGVQQSGGGAGGDHVLVGWVGQVDGLHSYLWRRSDVTGETLPQTEVRQSHKNMHRFVPLHFRMYIRTTR